MILLILKIAILILIIVLGLAAVLVLSVLTIPFKIEGNCATNNIDDYEVGIAAKWLWGILKFEFALEPQTRLFGVRLFNLSVYRKKQRPAPPKTVERSAQEEKPQAVKPAKKRTKEKSSNFSLSDLIEGVQSGVGRFSIAAVGELLHFLSRLLESLQIKVDGEAEVGLDDPADTGMLLGFFYAVTGALHIKGFSLRPNWDQLVLRASVYFSARLRLAQILLIALRTMLAKPIRRIWWPYAKQAINPFTRIRPQTA
jgi:hypothetical protein